MKCPICAGETVQKYRPFCSRRCADVDLARWMNGAYAVPLHDAQEAVAPDENSQPSGFTGGAKPH